MSTTTTRPAAQLRPDRLVPGAFAAAGVLFAAYPLLRPWSDETTLDGAAAMASPAWLASHVLAMVAFVLLALALHRGRATDRAVAHASVPASRTPVSAHASGAASGAAVAAWVGAVLVLPYYGAEAFGLQAIAARAVADGDPSLLTITDGVRYAPVQLTMFTLGLLALAVAGVLLAVTRWPAGGTARLGATATGAMLVLYLPQFFGTPTMRIAHGGVLAAGCVLLAVDARRRAGLPRT